MNEEDKIQEILAMNDRQLQVDIIRMMEQGKAPNKEKTFKMLIKQFVAKYKKSYPINDKKIKEEKRKYTESFKNAVKEEQKEKEIKRIRRQKKFDKVLKAYGKERDVIKDDKVKMQEFIRKCTQNEENTQSFLMQLYKYVNDYKEIITKEQSEEITTKHRQFMERMHPSSIEEIQHITKKSDDSKDIEK